MKSVLSISSFAFLFLVIIMSCSKQAESPVIATETGKNLPADNQYNLNEMEKNLAGTWICTDFKTERYDLDTNYLLTCDNMQGIRLRTYLLRPDKTCFTVDSFKYDIQHRFHGGWLSDGKYLTIGKGREKIVKCDADSLVTTWDWWPAGNHDSYGLDLYIFRYSRVK